MSPRWAGLRRALPWLVAAAILGGLALRLPRAELGRALASGPFLLELLFAVAVAGIGLVTDAWGTRQSLAATGVHCPFGSVLVARGATYLLGLLNSIAAQGGMAFYLHRAGVGRRRAIGTVLFLAGSQIAALAAVAAAGTAADPATRGRAGATLTVAATAVAIGLYLAIVAWRPDRLARQAVLAPAFAAGCGGFLRAVAARLPQALVMTAGIWVGLRLWGVFIPLGRGLAVISVVVLVMAVPVAPSGIGTMELALVELAAAAKTQVLAAALVYHLGSLIGQGLLGLLCLALLRRPGATGSGGSGGSGGAGCTVDPLAGEPPAGDALAGAALAGEPLAGAGG